MFVCFMRKSTECFLIYILSRSRFLELRAQPPGARLCNGGEERKTFQYFSESNDKENEVQKHFREKRIRETELSYLLASWNHCRGEFS